MKIRSNYVSNSSSSSYWVDSNCFMGINSNVLGYNKINFRDKQFLCFLNDNRDFTVYEGENKVIGMNISSMKDDETKNHFRERVYKILKRFGYDGKLEAITGIF